MEKLQVLGSNECRIQLCDVQHFSKPFFVLNLLRGNKSFLYIIMVTTEGNNMYKVLSVVRAWNLVGIEWILISSPLWGSAVKV